MEYQEIIELEQNIKIMNDAESICADFAKNVKLSCSKYDGNGKFIIWSDSNNCIYVTCRGELIEFNCRFLHNTYDIIVSPSHVFSAIKNKDRVVEHLRASIKRASK